jgi:hypothetical protein
MRMASIVDSHRQQRQVRSFNAMRLAACHCETEVSTKSRIEPSCSLKEPVSRERWKDNFSGQSRQQLSVSRRALSQLTLNVSSSRRPSRQSCLAYLQRRVEVCSKCFDDSRVPAVSLSHIRQTQAVLGLV